MKRILIASLILAACGHDDKKNETAPTGEQAQSQQTELPTATEPHVNQSPSTSYSIATVADLPKCGDENQKNLIYVRASSEFMSCEGTEWVKIDAVTRIETKTEVKEMADGFGNWVSDSVDMKVSPDYPNSKIHIVQASMIDIGNGKVRVNVVITSQNFPEPTEYLTADINLYSPVTQISHYYVGSPDAAFNATVIDWAKPTLLIKAANHSPIELKLTKK